MKGAERREKIDAVQVHCSPVNNRADPGRQEEMKQASATRKACENSDLLGLFTVEVQSNERKKASKKDRSV